MEQTSSPPHEQSSDQVAPETGQVSVDVLYRRHWEELVRFVRRTFGAGPPEPEDIAQTAFTHFAALARPQRIQNPRAFLFQTARNVMVDEHRRAAVRRRAAETGDASAVQESVDELDPERVLDGKQRLALLAQAVDALPQRMRRALLLHRFEEMSYVDVARHLGVSQTEAKRLVARALMACAKATRGTSR
ncbi:sigma-70 family RNA polymerase sigma factor [Novosphingobium sp.]|uniref:RNA polymerase sigma factor n=1 Tax=Novosphingobium sp. TaxID=1874826 RepID=UPI002610B794|nr:sigma-70 family RNA polymerase sigma factor [Novosphingobium sp.]